MSWEVQLIVGKKWIPVDQQGAGTFDVVLGGMQEYIVGCCGGGAYGQQWLNAPEACRSDVLASQTRALSRTH